MSLAAALAVLYAARLKSAPPARCASGMIALGARCCGEGQRLDDRGRCAEPPARCASGLVITPAGCTAPLRAVHVAGGTLHIGPGDWEAQGTVEPWNEAIAPFDIDAFEVNEARYTACEAEGACAALPKSGEPGRAVTGITLEEAQRFCRWAKGSLPTRAQFAFAHAGERPRRYAWGDTGAVCRRAAFGLVSGPCAWNADGPEITGSHPDGQTDTGIFDLSGNVAEWTLSEPPEDPFAEARGGAYTDSAAAALRTWHRRRVPVDTRAPDLGFRCVYPQAAR